MINRVETLQTDSRSMAMLATVGLLIWIVFLYRSTALVMVEIWWRSETFTHAFLVPPIALWLIWRKRSSLVGASVRPNLWFLPAVALVGFGWLLGDLVAVNAVTQLALVTMLILCVPAVCGIDWTRKILFPLGFLFFAVPIGEFAMPKLMDWTADFTVLALRFSGIPVFREGLQFVIPTGNWSVVEACSGVRYLIASVTVGTLFAYLNYQSTKRRVLFVLVSILVPVFANWVRAYLIVMLGHFSGNKLAAGVDHLIYGWVFFGIVIMAMFYIGSRWADAPLNSPNNEMADLPTRSSGKHFIPRNQIVLATFLVIGVVAWPVVAVQKIDVWNKSWSVQLVAPQQLSADWRISQQSLADWKPAFVNPSAQLEANYNQGMHTVGLYVGYYRQQGYQRKLVSSDNALVRSKDTHWALVEQGQKNIIFGPTPVSAKTAILRGSSLDTVASAERLIVRQFYWINGQLSSSDVLAKIYGAFARLRGRGDDAAVIIFYTPLQQGDKEGEILDEFAKKNGGMILKMLEMASNH